MSSCLPIVGLFILFISQVWLYISKCDHILQFDLTSALFLVNVTLYLTLLIYILQYDFISCNFGFVACNCDVISDNVILYHAIWQYLCNCSLISCKCNFIAHYYVFISHNVTSYLFIFCYLFFTLRQKQVSTVCLYLVGRERYGSLWMHG